MDISRVDVLKVDNPFSLFIRRAKGSNKDDDDFYFMERTMGDWPKGVSHHNDRIEDVRPEMICAGLCEVKSKKLPKKWYRIRVKQEMKPIGEPIVICDLIDYALSTHVQRSLIRQLPYEFSCESIKPQAIHCKLYGIDPQTLVTDYTSMVTDYQRCSNWDTSASDFLRKLTESDECHPQAIFYDEDPDEPTLKRIFLTLKNEKGRYCVNEVLVEKRYACYTSETTRKDIEDVSPRPVSNRTATRTSGHVQAPLRQPAHCPELKLSKCAQQQQPSSCRPKHSQFLQDPSVKKPTGRGMKLVKQLQKPDASLSEGCDSTIGRGRSVGARVSPPKQTAAPRGRGKFFEDLKSEGSTNPGERGGGDGARNPGMKSLKPEFRQINTPPPFENSAPDQSSQKLSPKLPLLPPPLEDSEPETGARNLPTLRHAPSSPSSPGSSGNQGVLRSRLPRHVREKMMKQSSSGSDSGNKSSKSREVKFSDSEEHRYFSKGDEVSTTPTPLGIESPIKSIMKTKALTEIPIDENYTEESHLLGSSLHEAPSDSAKQIKLPSDTLVYNSGNCKYTPDLSKIQLHEMVSRVLITKHVRQLTRLQSFMLPNISRGSSIVGIAPSISKYREYGGKTFGYLLPIISQLCYDKDWAYSRLPKGSEPLVLILCSGWKDVEKIFSQCAPFCGQPFPTCKTLYGGGSESTKEIELIKGCHILVCTPHALLRMLKKNITTLNRLAHLIIEDIDIITGEFLDEIREIMRIYAAVLKLRGDCQVPRQIVAVGTHWSPAVEAFTKAFMPDSPVIITSKIEAAHSGLVKQVAKVCHLKGRVALVANMMNPEKRLPGKAVVVTSDNSDCDYIEMVLKTSSIFALKIHDDLSVAENNSALHAWKESKDDTELPVLVITDESLGNYEADICDARSVIHYDEPLKRDYFEKRLWCMNTNFVDPFAKKEDAETCVSTFIVTENTQRPVHIIRQLLRCNSEVPSLLRDKSKETVCKKDKNQQSTLCSYLKTLGRCRDMVNCTNRHTIYEAIDFQVAPRMRKLPDDGTIGIKVTHVHNAGQFHARILYHKPNKKDEPICDDGKGSMLLVDMVAWFRTEKNKTPANAIPKVGNLYAATDNYSGGCIHRVELLSLEDQGSDGLYMFANVLFVDTGRTDRINRSDLLSLPDNLAEIPYQAIEIIVCRVRPLDNDIDWTDSGSRQIADDIDGLELEGSIVLRMGNTLWLDPIVRKEYLPHLQQHTIKFNLRDKLLSGFAQENIDHIQALDKLMEDQEIMPPGQRSRRSKCYTCKGLKITPRFCELPLPETDVAVEVYVRAINSPDLMFVVLKENEQSFNQLQDEIQNHVKYQSKDMSPSLPLPYSTLVLAKFPGEEDWYRAKIAEILRPGKYAVTFIDTGEEEDVEAGDILPLPARFQLVPFQAIECCLGSIKSPGLDWDEDCVDQLWEFLNSDVPLKVKVKAVSESCSDVAERKYSVDMWSFRRGFPIDVCEYMVSRGLAKFNIVHLQNLLKTPKVPTSNNIGDIIKETDVEKQQILFRNLWKNIITGNISLADSDGIDFLNGLVHSLGCLQHPETKARVLKAITELIKSDQMKGSAMEDFAATKLAVNFSRILDDDVEDDLFRVTIAALKSLLNFERVLEAFFQYGGLQLLCKVLSNQKTAREVLLDLVLICNHMVAVFGKSNVTYIQQKNGWVHSLCICLANNQNCSLATRIFDSFEKFISYPSMKDCIRKYGGLKTLCGCLKVFQNLELLESGIKLIRSLASNNRFNKDVMIEIDMDDTLLKLGNQDGLSEKAKETCKELRQRLHELKHNQSSRGSAHRLSKMNTTKEEKTRHNEANQTCRTNRFLSPVRREKPTVVWSQSKCSVLLIVKVRDIHGLRDEEVATISDGSVLFRGVSEETLYEFDIKLYEVVVPEKSKYNVRGSEVYIGLSKQHPGIWPRITKEKIKLSFLSSDVDRLFEISDSEDEEAEAKSREEDPFHLIKKNTRYVPFCYDVPHRGNLTQGVPERESSTSESNSESDPEDMSYENKDASRLGFHTF